MTSRRIVFLDVDGTLIDHDQRLAPAVGDAVRAARRNGHLLYLCTGRSRAEIPPKVSDLGFDGVISAGGGFVERDGQLLASHTMPADAVDDLVAFFRAEGIEYNLQGYDGVWPSEGLVARIAPLFSRRGFDLGADDGEGARIARRMAYRGPAPRTGIAKATFFGEHESTFATVRDGLGDRFHVITGTIPYLGESGGELSLAGIHKGAAIEELVGMLGMTLADAIAIGDSSNDLEMLAVAGVGIAMGNADGAVKEIADEITASVHDDGVATAFARHALI